MLENATLEDDGRIVCIEIPMRLRRNNSRKEILLPETAEVSASTPTSLQYALARAFRWQKMLDDGEVASISDLARSICVDKSFIAKQIRMTLLAPDIVRAILSHREPESLTMVRLLEPVPVLWAEQRKLYGFPAA